MNDSLQARVHDQRADAESDAASVGERTGMQSRAGTQDRLSGHFLIKVIPPQGYSVYRFGFTRAHVAGAALLAILGLAGAAGYHEWQLRGARTEVARLQSVTSQQRAKLSTIDRQTEELGSKLNLLERENRAIRRMLGSGHSDAPASTHQHAALDRFIDFSAIQARLRLLDRASAETVADEARLQGDVKRILNVRRLAEMAREQLIASIPSINPVGAGSGIASGFGYRTNPWPEYHQGVDLEADYGVTVRSAAAGTVVAAGWDGGFGNKVDVDHGNGYHTYYAHLSHIDVGIGQRVTKGEPIAEVGATGEATGPHLHYQIMHNGQPIDPIPFLTGVPPQVIASLNT